MATIAGYQVLHNNDGTNTEVLLFESCCVSCGAAFLAGDGFVSPALSDASVFLPAPTRCPRCLWAIELAFCCEALAMA
jgi:hypothetical protein